jgi:hypothetical protein
MSQYTPQISQSLKNHIWSQLNLKHTTKQIYDKHKTNWWECVNVLEAMMKEDFIQQQNIVYLDRKHKRKGWQLHKNLAI